MSLDSLVQFILKYTVSFTFGSSGATAIEYALIAGLIAIVLVGSLTTIGQEITNNFLNVIVTALAGS